MSSAVLPEPTEDEYLASFDALVANGHRDHDDTLDEPPTNPLEAALSRERRLLRVLPRDDYGTEPGAPIPFDGTDDEIAANLASHDWPGLDADDRCRRCDSRRSYVSAKWPCGADVPRTPWPSSSRQPAGPSPMAGADGAHYTDVGNAERLIAAHGTKLKFVPVWRRWLVYSTGRWRIDHADTLAAHLAAGLGRTLLDQVPGVYEDTAKLRALLGWVKRTESAAGIAATLTVAASQPGVAIDHEALDADPWLLNVRNGTIDLRTGTLRPHDPLDLLTMRANVTFDPEAFASAWEAFLERVLPDPAVRMFTQRLFGLALLGDQPEHVLPIAIGLGANGKSVMTRVTASVLGDYAVVASKDVLLALKHDAHPTARADLFRRRFAHSGELPPGAKLDEAQVKELTGGDRIKARRMREDFWEFSPSHLLWLHANHRPTIEGTDDGIWRRVLLIPFTVQIPPAERDPRLADRIIADESAGVLNWMLAGLRDYLEHGLDVPEIVQSATAAYRNESDTVAAFLADSGLVIAPNQTIPTSDLLAVHGEWFAAAGVNEPEKAHYQRVVTALKERGATSHLTKSRGRFWRGVGAP